MYNRTLNAADASARPISESSTQLPARRPVDCVWTSGRAWRLIFTQLAALQPQRAGTLPAPIGQRHRVFWALAVRCALRVGSLEAGCLSISWLYSSRRSPSMRSSCYMHGGFYTAPLAASLRQMRRGLAGAKEGTASLVCTHSIATSRAPRALRATMPPPRTTPGAQRSLPPQPARSSRLDSRALPSGQVACVPRANC